MTDTTNAMDMTVLAARQADAVGRTARVQGWVRTRRDSRGGFSFIELNDGSCQGNLQVVAAGALANYETEVKKLSAGSSVTVVGEVKASPAKGQPTELHAAEVRIRGWSPPETYPLQKKGHSYEFLRTIAHLRPRTNTFGAMARIRNRVSMATHDFFQERGFLYVHTPIITSIDCEGAGEMFRVTSMDLKTLPRRADDGGQIDYSKDLFGRPTYLTVSGQLQAEAMASALGKVYTFGPTFRAENSNTYRHLAEFWMIEPEAAFFDLEDDMELAEAFARRVTREVVEKCPEEVEFIRQRVDPEAPQRLQSLIDKPFVRIPYTEAVEVLKKSGESFVFPPEWGKDLQAEHERYLVEKHAKGAVIVYDYPRSIKPFYMRVNDDGKTVRAMDVLVPGVGEFIGGSQREERLDVVEQRMREQGLNPEDYSWYLDLRRYGTVPHAGFGLGLERILLFITGVGNIRDVIPFPRTPGNAEY